MDKKILAGCLIALVVFAVSSCDSKKKEVTTDISSDYNIKTSEYKTTVKETALDTTRESEIESTLEIQSETDNKKLNSIIDLDEERDDLIAFFETFIIEYVDNIKSTENDITDLLSNIQNDKLKKYVLYSINNKSYVQLSVPNEKTKCYFENIDIKKLDDKKVCFRGNVIFSDYVNYQKSSAAVGSVYVVLARNDGKNIVEDLYWDVEDSPDLLHRKEYNPYENYCDFWNDETKSNVFLKKLGIE